MISNLTSGREFVSMLNSEVLNSAIVDVELHSVSAISLAVCFTRDIIWTSSQISSYYPTQDWVVSFPCGLTEFADISLASQISLGTYH